MTEIRMAQNGPTATKGEVETFLATVDGNLAQRTSEPPRAATEDEQAIAYAASKWRSIEAERDQLIKVNNQLRVHISSLQATLDAKEAQIGEIESRCHTLQAERDQAVADRSVYEVLWISIRSQLQAFEPPTQPLTRLRPARPDPDTSGRSDAGPRDAPDAPWHHTDDR